MSRIMAQSSFISRTKEAERYGVSLHLIAFEYKLSHQPLSHIYETVYANLKEMMHLGLASNIGRTETTSHSKNSLYIL